VRPAWQDEAFAREARRECSRTYVVHLRCASTAIPVRPAHQLTVTDLDARAAESQLAEREAAAPAG
jgi:hypothetical protein